MKKKEKENENKKSEGFTFVETIAVLAVIAVMAAGTTASAEKIISKAKRVSARNEIAQYSAALQSYFLDCGRFPTTEQGLEALWFKPELYPVPENWKGPYIDRKPSKDPWGTDYVYYSGNQTFVSGEIPEGLPFVLLSFGADCQEGGEGDSEDVVSWK